MGMAVILVMYPWSFEHILDYPSHGSSTWNLASIDPVGFKEMFYNVQL